MSEYLGTDVHYDGGVWSRFVAVGDSYTEGMSDLYPNGQVYRGWADRLAEHLARHNPGLLYANIAIRGRTTPRIVEEQIPRAIGMQPDLVAFACGVNDLMKSNFDLETWAQTYERGVVELREAGTDVLITAFGDPTGRPGVLPKWIPRYRQLNERTVEIAQRHGCYLVNFWPRKELDRDVYWSDDRLHLSALGHQVTAELAADVLGIPFDIDSHALDPDRRKSFVLRRYEDARWLTVHALPYVWRHARGRSSGDGISEKRPVLAPVDLSRRV